MDRYQPFRDLAGQQGLDAVALVPGANFCRFFRKDFHQSERPLLVLIPATGTPAAVVPNLELGSFDLVGFEGEVFDWLDQTGYQSAFDALLKHIDVARVGVEGQSMRVFVHHAMMQAKPSLEIIDAEKSISSLRLHKNDEEIEALSRAVKISEQALTNTLAEVCIGMTETAIESILKQQMLACGGEEFSFGPIVAAGDNSARPHAVAREDYQLQAGDALLIDFGARYAGLCADITRTFFMGHASDEAQAVYDVVLQANLAGHAVTKPGVSAHDIDDSVTKVLEASNYADRIRHKTGHGLGRDIHEEPYIMRGNHTALEPGMVFTIEPGLYQSGHFGVRIEDDVVVTDDGVRCLTSFPKQLTVL